MQFNSPSFLLFFTGFFLLYSFVFVGPRSRVLWVCAGSLAFYGWWDVRYVPLLVFSALFNYGAALAVERSRRRTLLMTLVVGVNLGVLALFKYASAASQEAAALLRRLELDASLPVVEWMLPLGISFYTFQGLSYVIDVQRGKTHARRDPFQSLAALSFFPHLLAGPILRAHQVLPQLESPRSQTWPDAIHGLHLITAGLVKKDIADLLGGPAAAAFDASEPVGSLRAWTGLLAFAGQIYGDFSGYSDIAIGISLLLGFRLPLNFRLPYLALSPAEFWRRWHISLSSWIRDYLFFSIGGNRRHGPRNLVISMLVVGLWHGAAWTFLVWGTLQGVLLIVSARLETSSRLRPLAAIDAWWMVLLKWAATFYVVLMGFVIVRSDTLSSALDFAIDLHRPLSPAGGLEYWILVGCVGALAFCHLWDYLLIHRARALESRWWLIWPLLLAGQCFALLIGGGGDGFIYFRF